jgi:ComF family protein
MNFKWIFEAILELFYPRKCVFCEKLLMRNELDLCIDCRRDTEKVLYPLIKSKSFECCHSVYYYKDKVASAVKKLKFAGKISHADSFGRLLAMKLLTANVTADLITWVPISAKRKKQRGYDQGEELAKAVGRELGIPVEGLLQKVRHTPPQARVKDAAARKINIANAYAVADNVKIQGKRILLLDDVITSGATLSECSKVLRSAGAKSIVCGTFAAARH